MTIYLLSEGTYSDYRVLGVYTTREKAEAAAVAFGTTKNDDMAIEEYSLDAAPQMPEGLLPWKAIMYHDGRASVWRVSAQDFKEEIGLYTGGFDDDHVWVTLWARDADHAIKVASEKRRVLLALPEGPE